MVNPVKAMKSIREFTLLACIQGAVITILDEGLILGTAKTDLQGIYEGIGKAIHNWPEHGNPTGNMLAIKLHIQMLDKPFRRAVGLYTGVCLAMLAEELAAVLMDLSVGPNQEYKVPVIETILKAMAYIVDMYDPASVEEESRVEAIRLANVVQRQIGLIK